MKLVGLVAFAVFVALGPPAEAQPYAALRGVTVFQCQMSAITPCAGAARPLPGALEDFHKLQGKTEPWTNPYVPLSAAELATMAEFRDAVLTPISAPVPDRFKKPEFEFRTADKYFQSFDEARQYIASSACKTATAESLSYETDAEERYGLLMFACEVNGESTTMPVSIGIKGGQISRVYINWTVKIYANLAKKSP